MHDAQYRKVNAGKANTRSAMSGVCTFFEGRKQYGMAASSHTSGKCTMMSTGDVSAANRRILYIKSESNCNTESDRRETKQISRITKVKLMGKAKIRKFIEDHNIRSINLKIPFKSLSKTLLNLADTFAN